ncbi:hypothetical protein ACFY7C_34915 [Streptomyces sp. NPDC012769]|uniref:hypothetical protein n=1 Tax=Streptomyces sp. NPDC012769 TaxID=3364848 RepID=UPI003694C388
MNRGLGRAMDEATKTLEHEFRAEPGSFLLRLRCELVWDREGFSRLEKAMRAVCEQMQGAEQLPRWLAEGYHHVATDVPSWTAHPNFPRPEPQAYYDSCVERLTDLADWFFRGEHVYQEPHVWPELQA